MVKFTGNGFNVYKIIAYFIQLGTQLETFEVVREQFKILILTSGRIFPY